MTPTLAQSLSLIAPAYSAREHARAAESMVEDMEKNTHTKYEIRADNPDPSKAEEWAIFATAPNCHAHRIACTTNKDEAVAMLMGLKSSAPDLLAALEALVDDADTCEALACNLNYHADKDCKPINERFLNNVRATIKTARAAIAKARAK